MPKITEVIVSAGRTFNDPYEQYANFKPAVTIKATLSEDEEPETIVKELQRKTEAWMFEHKALMLHEIRKIKDLKEAQRNADILERQLQTAQEELADLKRRNPELFAAKLQSGDDQAE